LGTEYPGVQSDGRDLGGLTPTGLAGAPGRLWIAVASNLDRAEAGALADDVTDDRVQARMVVAGRARHRAGHEALHAREVSRVAASVEKHLTTTEQIELLLQRREHLELPRELVISAGGLRRPISFAHTQWPEPSGQAGRQ